MSYHLFVRHPTLSCVSLCSYVRVLHVKNVEYVAQVKTNHAGGLLFETVMRGQYAVDTFLFIGATLVSFLLLRAYTSASSHF